MFLNYNFFIYKIGLKIFFEREVLCEFMDVYGKRDKFSFMVFIGLLCKLNLNIVVTFFIN